MDGARPSPSDDVRDRVRRIGGAEKELGPELGQCAAGRGVAPWNGSAAAICWSAAGGGGNGVGSFTTVCLTRGIRTARHAHVDDLIEAGGRYALIPDGRISSGSASMRRPLSVRSRACRARSRVALAPLAFAGHGSIGDGAFTSQDCRRKSLSRRQRACRCSSRRPTVTSSPSGDPQPRPRPRRRGGSAQGERFPYVGRSVSATKRARLVSTLRQIAAHDEESRPADMSVGLTN